jgi:hypothetical protein
MVVVRSNKHARGEEVVCVEKVGRARGRWRTSTLTWYQVLRAKEAGRGKVWLARTTPHEFAPLPSFT